MSKQTSILCILLTVSLLLVGCKQMNNLHHSEDSSENVGSVSNPFASVSSSPNYDPSAEHGVKSVYGYSGGGQFDRREPLNSWGDYYFQWDLAWLLCYDRTGESIPVIPCFDPLCNHEVDTCPAFYQFDSYDKPGDRTETYPYYIFCDYYDNANSPVFYSVYRRSSVGHLGTEDFDQDPYYMIQRYDFASGQRVTLYSGIQSLIHSVYTYGDYLYYTISEDYLREKKSEPDESMSFTLCMLPKSGGEPVYLQDENTKSLDILDITDDGVYYLVNSRYIYRCSPTLEHPEMLLDMDSVEDENGNHVQLAAVRDGYIFCFGNFSAANPEYSSNLNTGDCYRMPLENPTTDVVKIVEHMLCPASYFLFTENYLYYMPAVMEELTGSYYYVNHSNGVVKAVHLFTGETITCCEDTGISFYTGFVDGDYITIYGAAYEEKGEELGTGYKHIRLYPDGRPAEYWFDRSTQRNGFVIGSWNE